MHCSPNSAHKMTTKCKKHRPTNSRGVKCKEGCRRNQA